MGEIREARDGLHHVAQLESCRPLNFLTEIGKSPLILAPCARESRRARILDAFHHERAQRAH